jgi:hypothetical protein
MQAQRLWRTYSNLPNNLRTLMGMPTGFYLYPFRSLLNIR